MKYRRSAEQHNRKGYCLGCGKAQKPSATLCRVCRRAAARPVTMK